MATGFSTNYQGDIGRYLSARVLPVAQRHLVLRQFADKIRMPSGEGLTWTATRVNRFTIPNAPLNEGVPPVGQAPTIQQVTGVCVQWGDRSVITDVASLTPKHDMFQQAIRMMRIQMPETYERNLFVQMNALTQVNYVNSRGARASLVAGDVLDPTTVNRTVVNLKNLGAPLWNGAGPEQAQINDTVDTGLRKASRDPKGAEHYVAIGSPLVIEGDFASNSTVQLAWSYSDINRLYINEVGQWRGMRFVSSNMLPSWTGIAQVNGSAGTSGSLATGTYYIQVTGSDTQNQYESQIYQISASISVTGPNGSISVTTPTTAGFTYSIYCGTSATVQNQLGLTTSGPTVGPYAGQAVQIAPATTVTITGLGMYQVPPNAPATGVTVYRTYVFGQQAFAALEFGKVEWIMLTKADKSDPLNQLKIVGWKGWDGAIILNQNFAAAIESSVSSTGTFT